MLRPRITPCLLIHERGLVKTVGFGDPKYIGDPINAVKIFNEKHADELIVLDIDATTKGVEPDYKLIEKLAAECRMPLCYGGGISTPEQANRIIGLGVEKVAISAAAVKNPTLLTAVAALIGRQSVVAVLDVKKRSGILAKGYEVRTHNGRTAIPFDPIKLAVTLQDAGAGEVIINVIDRDGQMKGYDLSLARQIRAVLNVPMTMLGGAGSADDIAALYATCGIVGAAVGSMFVFKGPYRAVLINYPTDAQKNNIYLSAAQSEEGAHGHVCK